MNTVLLGQNNLYKTISLFERTNVPNNILIVGDEGSGKSSSVDILSSTFNLKTYEISNITLETVEFIESSIFNTILYFDIENLNKSSRDKISLITDKNNNIVVVMCKNKYLVPKSILFSFYEIQLERYSDIVLKTFINNDDSDLVLKYFRTPGKILKYNNDDLKEFVNLCNLIVDKIEHANYESIFKVSDRFSKYSKIFGELNTSKILLTTLKDKILISNSVKLVSAYSLIQELIKKLSFANCECSRLFDKFFIDLHKIMKESNE